MILPGFETLWIVSMKYLDSDLQENSHIFKIKWSKKNNQLLVSSLILSPAAYGSNTEQRILWGMRQWCNISNIKRDEGQSKCFSAPCRVMLSVWWTKQQCCSFHWCYNWLQQRHSDAHKLGKQRLDSKPGSLFWTLLK